MQLDCSNTIFFVHLIVACRSLTSLRFDRIHFFIPNFYINQILNIV